MKASLSCLARLSAVLANGRTRSKTIKATFILALALAAVPAMAQTITFTISADGSGTLGSGTGSVAFTDQLITFTQVTDITAIKPCPIYLYPCAPSVGGNTVTIGAMAPLTIAGNSYFFDNAINVVGITNAAGTAFLGAEDGGPPGLGTYTMTTNFGPNPYPLFSVFGGLSTSGGALSITYSGDATFQAVVGSPTPEPASFFLMGSGLLAMGGILRRRILRR
jgi:PEP-CTERM motif